MDFKQLNTFLTVAQFLNFTKAAEQLGYAQSSITAQIQQLENETGVKLFERIGKTVSLTYAGTMMIPYASKLLEISKNMKSALSEFPIPSGTLTIGVAESLSIYRLPHILKEYRRLYPNVDIHLKLLNCKEFIPNLANGSIDIAYCIGYKLESEALVEVLAMPEPVTILAYHGHPLLNKSKVIPNDFENIPLLLTGNGCCYRGSFLKSLSELHITPRIIMETDSIQAIKQAAISGLGICVLPEIAASEEISSGRLLPLPYSTDDFPIVSQMLYHKDKWMSPALSAFISLSKEFLIDRK